jgi:hypothetical protein
MRLGSSMMESEMRLTAAVIALALIASPAQAQERKTMPAQTFVTTPQHLQTVAPALESLTEHFLERVSQLFKLPFSHCRTIG